MANQKDYIVDGIDQEAGRVPRWWKNVLLTFCAFCPFYMLYYHVGAPGRSLADSYDNRLAAAAKARFAELGDLKADEPTVLEFMQQDNWVKVGKQVFKSNCATCHGRDGEGQVGPNLTDENYKHIRDVGDIVKVILKGANNNAMPAWEEKLDVNEVVMVSAYVANLRGTNVDGGKAAEGIEIAPWGSPQVE